MVRPNGFGKQDRARGKATSAPSPDHAACHQQNAGDQVHHHDSAAHRSEHEDSLRKTEQALHDRRQFWMDTCREVREMRTASRRVLELHRQYGCRFWVPNAQQVQQILDALDAALPGWEHDHPGLFYQTLEVNFPEVLRVRPRNYR